MGRPGLKCIRGGNSGKYKQGVFKLDHPEKYKGPIPIITRSSWEYKFARFLDNNSNVIRWGSEPIDLVYISPVDGRSHRYFPDFIVQIRTPTGEILTQMVEIKPYRQTQPPIISEQRSKKRMIYEVNTFKINMAKWAVAKAFCDRQKWKFVIITEKDLY